MDTELNEDLMSVDPREAGELVKELQAELLQVYEASGTVLERRRKALDWRFCRWDGQSDDGRKHAEDLERQPHPFEGASDTRIHLVDELVNENVVFLVNSFWRSQMQAHALTSESLGQAGNVSTFLDWMKNTALRKQLNGEVELLAQIQEGDDPAMGILGVFFHEERRTVREELGLIEAANAVLAASGLGLEHFEDTVESLARGDDAAALLLRTIVPELTEKAAKWAVKERERTREEFFTLKLSRPHKRLPRFVAFRPAEDIWYDWQQDDLQEARVIFTRELLTESQLRARVAVDGWDEKRVEELIKKGPEERLFRDTEEVSSSQEGGGYGALALGSRRLFEVFCAWRKAECRETGNPEVWQTYFSGALEEPLADDPLGYRHGMYPFIDFRRERTGRGGLESRGISKIAGVHQTEKKLLRDCRNDQIQMATTPPWKVLARRGGAALTLRPNSELPVTKMDEIERLDPPPFPNHAIEMENAVQADMDSYFGRVRPDGSPTRGALFQQFAITRWLNNWACGFEMALELCAQYMSLEEQAAIMGVALGREEMVDLTGRYTLVITADARDLDLEFVGQKMGLVRDLIALDDTGVIDRSLVGTLLAGIDPQLASRFVKDLGSVTQREVDDETSNVLKLAAGIPVQPKKNGQNHQLRAKTLIETIGRSPMLSQLYQDPERPYFKDGVDERLKHFEFMGTQRQNAVTGQVGVPVANN